MDESKITQDELFRMFGGTLPMEAVQVIFGDEHKDKTVGEIRAMIREIAARWRPSDMVEKLARALFGFRMNRIEGTKLRRYTWEEENEPYRANCLAEARLVLETLREPTEEMLQAAVSAPRDMAMRDSLTAQAKAVYAAQHRAAIDSALNGRTA